MTLALPLPPPPFASRTLRLVLLFAACALAMGGAYLAGQAARRDAASLPRVAVVRPTASPPARAVVAPLTPTAPPLRGALADARDLECLTQAVYYEARGEPEGGQAAVAQVVLNRTRAGRYPRSVCGVVFQHARGLGRVGCQFSFACDRRIGRPSEREAWARAERVARAALVGRRAAAIGGATQFRVAGLSSDGLQRVARIGAHVFYRLGHPGTRPPPAAPTAPPAPAATAPTPPAE